MAWLLVALGMLLLYQGAVIAAMAIAWRNPRVAPQRSPDSLGLAFSEVGIPTANGRCLHGWWVPAGTDRRPTVILVHGWGRSRERMLPYIEMLHPAGFHLLAFDARHHGASDADGHASMKKFSEDIRAAVDFLAARPDVDANRIGVVGLSIGGSAAIHAAAHDRRIRAVASVGSFAHPRDAMLAMGFGHPALAPGMALALRFLEWRIGARLDDLAPERHAMRVEGRLLVIHGEDDAIVPSSHADRLARAAQGRAELWKIAGRGHSDPHREPGFSTRLVTFLTRSLAGAPRVSGDEEKAGAA